GARAFLRDPPRHRRSGCLRTPGGGGRRPRPRPVPRPDPRHRPRRRRRPRDRRLRRERRLPGTAVPQRTAPPAHRRRLPQPAALPHLTPRPRRRGRHHHRERTRLLAEEMLARVPRETLEALALVSPLPWVNPELISHLRPTAPVLEAIDLGPGTSHLFAEVPDAPQGRAVAPVVRAFLRVHGPTASSGPVLSRAAEWYEAEGHLA